MARAVSPEKTGYLFFFHGFIFSVSQEICTYGEEHADVANVDGEVEGVEDPVEGAGGDHDAGVHSSTHDTAQWVPRVVVEPIEEVIVAALDELLRLSVLRVHLIWRLKQVQRRTVR